MLRPLVHAEMAETGLQARQLHAKLRVSIEFDLDLIALRRFQSAEQVAD
jgi:hypothetical protein